jgi:hypothetical protein
MDNHPGPHPARQVNAHVGLDQVDRQARPSAA